MSHPDHTPALEALRSALSGSLFLPEDAEWEEARLPWNRSVEQRPRAVAVPADVEDIRRIVATAAETGLGVTVQPQGHGATTSLDDCILIRPSALNEISVDPEGATVRAEAGAMWGEVLQLLDGTGFIALAGSNPEVSVVGYSLGGGHSAFSRAYGLAAHSITAVELVDASGELRRVTAESDPELFWALRGGGGLFGIVTALELKLFPENGLYGGKLTFPGSKAKEAFSTLLEIMKTAPDELSLYAGLVNLPDLPHIPEPLRGQTIAAVDAVYFGDAETGAKLIAPLKTIAPLLADTTGAFSVGQLAALAAEPTTPSPSTDWARLVSTLNEESLSALLDGFAAGSEHGLGLLQFRPLGGAIANPPAGDTAVAGTVTAGATVFASVGLFPGNTADPAAAFAPIAAALDEIIAPGAIFSLLSAGRGVEDAYDTEAIARLAAVKQRVDPGNLIRSNRPLPE